MDSKTAMYLLRRMRHDYANHVQVISGWLELGQPEMIRIALLEMQAMLERDAEILHNSVPEAALFLYECVQQSSELGIDLVCGEISTVSWEYLQLDNQPMSFLRSVAQDPKWQESEVFLSVRETERNGGIELFLTLKSDRGGEFNHTIHKLN